MELGCTAVATEAVSRATSFLIGKYNKHNNVQEWIDRLVMAQIEIESALLISEEFDINNDEPLHQWQDKLKEAVCEAKEALSNFQAETEILHEEPNQTIEGGSSARDQSVQEEGSDDATLSHPASNIREAVAHQVNLEENLPHDQSVHEEGSDDATLVLPASNLREAGTRQVYLEVNIPHDPPMQEDVFDIEELQEMFREMASLNLKRTLKYFMRDFKCRCTDSPWPAIIERLSAFSRLLEPRTFSLLDPRTMVVKYLENDEKVSKLIKTVEKLEKMAGEIGVFIELLKLQLKRKMCRKRKRSGVALLGFFLVLPLKLQTYALFCYGGDPSLLVIMLFRAICTVPTGITGDIFIELIM